MWSDNETSIDYLNYIEVAEVIVDLVADATLLPLSVGVYGGWGAGKSSVLRLVEAELSKRSDVIVIDFDAWLYQGYDEAKSAMMTVIATRLLSAAPVTMKDKALDLVKRANKLRFLGLGAEAGLAALGVPTFGLINRGIGAVQDIWAGNGDAEDAASLKEGVVDAQKKATGLFSPKEIKSPPEEIEAFKALFSEVLRDMEMTLVVFVDNLDRCLPENAIKSLEAMRLFLSMDKAAFVVAADVDIIRHAVSTQFKGASEKHVIDYLDKLIQFPVNVPKLGVREVLSFLCMLVASRSKLGLTKTEELRSYLVSSIQNSWQAEETLDFAEVLKIVGDDADLASQMDMAFRIAPILAHSKSVSGNPRLIKRMMNVVRARYATAKRRNMMLDEAVITKLALFERCTDETAFKALLDLINSAEGGKPQLFEGAFSSSTRLPEALENHRSFVESWLSIEPSLAGINLKPAIYLARDTMPLQLQSKTLSAASKAAVQELLKVATLSSPAAKTTIASIPQPEVLDVMQELINRLRQNSDWSNKRNDINGAILLGQTHPQSAEPLMRFFDQLSGKKPWLMQMIKMINE